MFLFYYKIVGVAIAIPENNAKKFNPAECELLCYFLVLL